MSPQHPLESSPSPAEQPQGDTQVVTAPRDLASFPERLFAHDMAVIFRVSLKRVYELDAEGAFLFAENRPRIGRKSWSRERVKEYFAGTLRGLTTARRRA